MILSFDLQGGLERITKYMMTSLLVLMLVLAVHSLTLSGAADGLKFYLVPDFSKINGSVIVGAMNQAFFTLSVGMGGMAIFGSYIDKKRSLMGESVTIILLDTLVAVLAGIIMFPACFTYGLEVNAGHQPVIRHHGGLSSTTWLADASGAHCFSCSWCSPPFQQSWVSAKIFSP